MRAILAVLILILASVPLIAAQKTTIMVRPECVIAGSSCTIGDMASVQSADVGTVRKVSAVTVCSSPLPGKSRIVPQDQIVIALRRAGIADGAYDLLCPAQIAVKRSQTSVSGRMLFDAAKAFAESAVAWPGTTVIEPMRLPADQPVPTGKLELRVKAGTKSVRKGQNSIPVEIVVDNRVYRMTHVTVVVKVLASVLVASQTIARSEAISGANTRFEERDITRLPDDVLLEMPASECIAFMPIAQDSIVRRQWVSAPPAVKAGDSVVVVVESEGVRVSDKGTAVQEGRPGDRIKVRLSGDAREIRGTVAEPGVVKISLGRRAK